ncbi:hypothetical protein LX36DRAFT_674069 [Colletotrichum falcatum]|nr:hypothetical protein LX36DRAFT_674069 [Colletotrichum falcatum]
MGLIITDPAARPTSSPPHHPLESSPTTFMSSERVARRQEEKTRITITQTLVRPSGIVVATATLHGELPLDPPAKPAGGLSNKQVGAAIGISAAGFLGLLLLGLWCFNRRQSMRSYPKSSRPLHNMENLDTRSTAGVYCWSRRGDQSTRPFPSLTSVSNENNKQVNDEIFWAPNSSSPSRKTGQLKTWS